MDLKFKERSVARKQTAVAEKEFQEMPLEVEADR